MGINFLLLISLEQPKLHLPTIQQTFFKWGKQKTFSISKFDKQIHLFEELCMKRHMGSKQCSFLGRRNMNLLTHDNKALNNKSTYKGLTHTDTSRSQMSEYTLELRSWLLIKMAVLSGSDHLSIPSWHRIQQFGGKNRSIWIYAALRVNIR